MITPNTDSTFTQVKLDNPPILTLHNATVAEVIEMTTQRSVEKHSVRSSRKHESRICERTERFSDLLLNAVDETLKEVFKEAGAKVIHNFLGNKCHLKRKEIGEKPEDFSAGLERLLGSAAPMIEKSVLKNLCFKLRLEYEEKDGFGFLDYLRELREKADVKT